MIDLAEATCRACGATHRVELSGPVVGDIPTAEVETWPCQGADGCTTRVCRCCRIRCSECGLWVCDEHVIWVNGKPLCATCVEEAAE